MCFMLSALASWDAIWVVEIANVASDITPAIIATLIGVLWVLLFHRARSFLIVLVIYSAVVILCLAIGFAFSKIGVKGISKGKMFK
jgi:hypothetical protein